MKTLIKTAIALSAVALVAASCCNSSNKNNQCDQPCCTSSVLQGERGSEDFRIGVAGFTFRKFTIDETLAFLKEMGVHNLSVKDFWLPLDASSEQMDAFKAKCAEYEVDPYILGPIYMKSREAVDAAFDYVGRFGHKMFIGVPNYELLDYTIAKVKETGIKIAIHTHGPDSMPFPNIKEIVDRVQDPSLGVGCCLDMGHAVRYGDDLVGDIVAYKDWIYDIHIKDETSADKNGRTWEMGRGVMNFKAIVCALRSIDYKGCISVEFEKNAEAPALGVAESVGYLRAALDFTK